jgi:hypothetical protein
MDIKNRIPVPADARIRLGVGFLFSCFQIRNEAETTVVSRRGFLKYAAESAK